MQWIAILALLAACEGSSPVTVTPEPGLLVRPDDARIAVTLGEAASAPVPPPASSTMSIPPELANAPASIFRRYYTGEISPTTAVTFTLRRHEHAVLLTIEKRTRYGGSRPGTISRDHKTVSYTWTADSTTRYLGTARDDVLSLTDLDSRRALKLTCKKYRAAIARADAVRKKGVPPKGECEGEVGRFVPGATKRAELLYCYSAEPISGAPEGGDWNGYGDDIHVAFAPAPGVEWLYVNDDCSMQGGGFRWIAKDGAIANAR